MRKRDGRCLHVVDVADGSFCGLHLLDRHLNHVLNVLRVAVDDEGDELQVLVVLNVFRQVQLHGVAERVATVYLLREHVADALVHLVAQANHVLKVKFYLFPLFLPTVVGLHRT